MGLISVGIEGCAQPRERSAVERHNVEPARRWHTASGQVLARREHDALALARANAGRCATVTWNLARAHFDEHDGAIRVLHDQVDFAATTPGGPIIAHNQAQPGLLQMAQRGFLEGIARLLAAAHTRNGPESGKHHR